MKLKGNDKKTLITGLVLAAVVIIVGVVGFKAISRYRQKEEAAQAEYEKQLAQRYWEKEAEAEAEKHRHTGEEEGSETSPEAPTVEGPVVTVIPTPMITYTPTPEPTPTPKPLKKITASVSGGNKSSGARVGISYVFSSSEMHQDGYDNSGWAAVDGNDSTSWQEDVKGHGEGELLYFTFDSEHDVDCIVFKMGNWADEGSYYANDRPKGISIWLGEYFFSASIPDGMNAYTLKFSSPVPAGEAYIRVDSVYKGTYDDCCISEIGFYE